MAGWESRRLEVRRLRMRERLERLAAAEGPEAGRRPPATSDKAWADADVLVRRLLQELNAVLLTGQGTLRRAPLGISHGSYLWELWWEPTAGPGRHVLVTLLRDSRGTPYLRVHGRRIALSDALLEGRLQRALQAAFAQPRSQQSEDDLLMQALDSLLGRPSRGPLRHR